MSCITKSDYFFYGSSAIDSSGQHVQFGLFNAIDNRFVLTSTRDDVLIWLSFLFSSRYNLSVYRLTTAKNFQPNLIDNEVCTRWTIGKEQMLRFTRYNEWRDVTDVISLVECTDPIHPGLLVNDIPYLMAGHQWIDSCLFRCQTLGIDHILTNKLIDLPLVDPVIDACKHIFDIIYNEPDFQQARMLIEPYEKNDF